MLKFGMCLIFNLFILVLCVEQMLSVFQERRVMSNEVM
jgi:hypothetical protein